MTSSRKAKANRKNARKSTGPRSTSGKARASKNALKHGLSVTNSSAQVETLGQRTGDLFPEFQNTSVDRERVEEIIAIQDFLIRIRRAKADVLNGALEKYNLGTRLDEYRRIDRYERRAISRRKTVIRSLFAG